MQPGSSTRFTGWGNYPAYRLLSLNAPEPYTGPETVYFGACTEPTDDGEPCGGDLTAITSEFGTNGVETHCGTCQVCDRHDHGLTTEELS